MKTTEPRFALRYEVSNDNKELKESLCKKAGGRFVDTLTVNFVDGVIIKSESEREDTFSLSITIQTNFFSQEDGVFCKHGDQVIKLDIAQLVQEEGTDWTEWRAWLDKSNRDLGLQPSPEDVAEVARRANKRSEGQNMTLQSMTLQTAEYNFQTGLESDWLIRAASDGSRNDQFRKDPNRRALIYEQSGASHRVELCQDAPETNGEQLEMDALEWLVTRQNADFGFTFFYVCRLLAPPSPLESNRFAGGWIDLDDVALKIGYDVDGCTAAQREELRAQVWQFLNFGARALVIGQRKEYRDHVTGQKIETRVDSPPWRILDTERPVQTAMFGETPRRVQLLISKEWEPLLTASNLAQYLPFANIAASIPANQTAGAWARVLGAAIANFWRRHPHEATGAAPAIHPTRRELLTRYTPKKNPPLELLTSSDPKRAVKYWRDAIAMLRERGFIAHEAEATRTVAQMLEPFGRKGWQNDWLNERVDLRPGPLVIDAIRERAAAKHVRKPRALGAAKRRALRKKELTE